MEEDIVVLDLPINDQCDHYINRDKLLNEINKYKKILVILPRRSGKTTFLHYYCTLQFPDKKIIYYGLTRKLCTEFLDEYIKSNTINDIELIPIYKVKDETKCREIYSDDYIILFDESIFMTPTFLSNYLYDDTKMISISSNTCYDNSEHIDIHKKNGFHILYAESYCICTNPKNCRWKNTCIYCGCMFQEGWKRCPYCNY